MSLQHLAFKEIDEKALAALVASGAWESKTLEFKADLQVATDEQKREFLSDVTALANTDGGDILFGMRAENGVAKELMGLRNFVPDDRIGTLENLLRDFVQPRLMGHQIEARLLANGNHALLVRVGRSFASPHMVRHQGITRFCGRNSNGKYDLGVNELRSAFLASETMSDRLRNFRLDRINKLASGSGPIALSSPHLMVLHLLPVVSARAGVRFGTGDFERMKKTSQPEPIANNGYGSSFNMDGLLVKSHWGVEACNGFVQIYRNGFLEAVESQTLAEREKEGLIIPGVAWERSILEVFPGYLKALETLKIAPPYVASISLLNVRGYTMYVGLRYCGRSEGKPVDRDHLLTDEVLIESVAETPGKILRPLFDEIWNGCGWSRSLNYDEKGEWVEHR
jgi:hypothetical protein